MDATQLINESLVGRYVIERELGVGGMATVYLARDVRHDRKVALKVLHPDLAAALGAERFLAEIRTTANLQHPHILPLHDSGEAGGYLFYVMPYVQGETLRDRLTRESLLPIDDALRIAREVGGALDYAHRQGIVHRDVKPENILLHDGSAMVADFGISLAVSAAGTNRMTQTGLSLGTPHYMSPEQAMGEKSVDSRTDIYALGAVTYEMLCGEPPFSGASVQAIVAKVLTERPTPPSTVRDTVPASVEAAVLKALAKLPVDRFATAKAFVEALAPDAVTTASASVYTRRGTVGVVSSRRRWIGVTAAAAGGVLAGAALAATAMTSRAATSALTERYVLGEFPLLDIAIGSSMTYTGSPLAIAANGSRVAFVTTDSAGTHVEVRDLDRLETRAVRGTSGATSIAISPDGSAIAYVIDGQLSITDVRAGTPRVVASNAVGPYWGDDGRIYFCAPTIGDGVGGVFRVSANGGKIDTLLTRPGTDFYDPVPSPSGHAVLVLQRGIVDTIGWFAVGSDSVRTFVEGNTARFVDAGHIVFRSADGILMKAEIDADAGTVRGKPDPLMDGASAESPLMASRFVIARNGSLVYVAGGGAETEFAWIGRDGRVIAILDSSIGTATNAAYPTISPDGSRFAYADDRGIHVYDFAQRTGLRLTMGNTAEDASYPAWTPDGKSISYYALVTDGDTTIAALYLKPADGSGLPRQIARIDRSIGESAWSPDGKWVLFRTFSNQPGAGDIFGLRFGVDSAPIPLFATNASELLQTISPDGNWMAYATNLSGRQEVVVVPFPNVTAAAWSVSSDGGSEPRWSRSGRELFYRNARGDMISVPINPGSTFAFGSPRRLFSASQFHAYSGHAAYDVSLDGQRFLMGAPARSRLKPRLIFVKNFAPPLP